MTALPAPVRDLGSLRSPLALAAIAAVVAGAFIGLATSRATVPSAMLFLLLPAALAVMVAPVRALPVIALLAVVLIPLDQVSSPSWMRHIPVAALPIGALLLRAPILRPLPPLRIAIAAIAACWMLASLVHLGATNPEGVLSGASWTLVVIVCILLAAATPRRLPGRDQTELLVIAVLAALAAFAVVESRILHANPIYGHLFASGDAPILQKWGGGYRATTSLGHPLVNGLIFATGLVLAAGRALSDVRHRIPLGVASLLLAGGIFAAQSRASLLAAGFGLSLMLFAREADRGTRRRSMSAAKIGLAAAMVVGGLIGAQMIASRLGSTEAANSASDRAALPRLVVDAMRETGPLGAGPAQGANFTARERLASVTNSTRLESGVAELLVGTGIPGAVLFYSLLGLIVVAALRSPEHAAAGGAIAAFAAASAAFNAFESHGKVLVLLGVLIVLATARPSSVDAVAEDAT